MSFAVSMHGWRRLAGLIGFSLTIASGAFPAVAADTTNTTKIEPRQLREDLIKNQLQNDMFRKWGNSRDSLGGQVLPPLSQPALSPAQMRELKEQLAEQRYWMFRDPDDAGKAPTLEEQFKLDRSAPGLLDGLDAGTPRVLQRYYSRGRRGETNGAAQDERDYRNDLGLKIEDPWSGKAARGKTSGEESRSVFAPVETAASKVISRLFQPNGGRALEVSAGPGLFAEVFSPPASIPMERSPETIQRRSDFQKLLDAPAAPVMGNAFSPLPTVTAGAGGFGGLNNFAAPRAAAGFSGAGSASSLLGASTPPAVAAPAPPAITQFQPVTPPRRRF